MEKNGTRSSRGSSRPRHLARLSMRAVIFAALAMLLAARGAMAQAAEPLVYPPSGEILSNKKPVIGVDFQAVSVEIDPASLRMTLDRSNITEFCDIGRSYIFFKPAVDLLPGEHEAYLEGRAVGGAPLEAIVWKFFIKESFDDLKTYPMADAELQVPRPIIGANFSRQFPEGMREVYFYLDGKDMTASCDAGSDYIFFTPEKDLAAGEHEAEIAGRDNEGRKISGIRWRFSIAQSAVAPIEEPPAVAAKPAPKKGISFQATIGKEPAAPAKAEAEVREMKEELFDPDKVAADEAQAKIQEYYDALQSAREFKEELEIGYLFEDMPSRLRREKLVPIAEWLDEQKDQVSFEELKAKLQGGEAEEQRVGEPRIALEHSYDATVEWESVRTSGNKTRSVKREEAGFNYDIGLRSVGDVRGDTSFVSNLKLRGFMDPDVSERRFEVLSYTGTFSDELHKLMLYEIDPRFSAYTLNGQRLRGGSLAVTRGEDQWDVFEGAMKNPRSGRHVQVSGARVTRQLGEKSSLGLSFVKSGITNLRQNNIMDVNKLLSFTFNSQFDQLKMKGEIVRSYFTGLEADEAWNFESSLRRGKSLYTVDYENTGEYVRSEAGSIPKGIRDFSIGASTKVSERLKTLMGYKIRTLKSSGSRTKTLPISVTYQPLKSDPDAELRWKYTQKKNTQGLNRRNTRTSRFEFKKPIGIVDMVYSFEQEVKTRTGASGKEQQDQDIKEVNTTWNFSETRDLKFVFKRLTNNLFGDEDRYKLSWHQELRDWTDVKLTYELVDKSQETLGRNNYAFLFTQHNPKKDTDVSMDLRLESYYDYKNTLMKFKYGITY